MDNTNKHVTFINVAGFFGSGSSAVVDLLKEFEGFYECNAEIRFIKDPGGISDLEHSLVDRWELINSAAAIADFKKMIKKGCRHGRHIFSRAGLGYKRNININFLSVTENYLNKLTKYKYIGDFYHFKFKKKYLKFLFDRYRTAIEYYTKGRLKTGNRRLEPLYFSHPTKEEFYNATKDYMEDLFAPRVEENSYRYIILDQAVSPNNPDVIEKYFHDSKLIIVDRDPRDTFVNEYKSGCYLDNDYNTYEGGHNYVIRQRALRAGIKESSNILYIRFEDLILNYEACKSRIADFIGIPLEKHINQRKYLKPEISAKNIGLWKKYYAECGKAIDAISEELPDLCYSI